MFLLLIGSFPFFLSRIKFFPDNFLANRVLFDVSLAYRFLF
jgi:hypothetical protein